MVGNHKVEEMVKKGHFENVRKGAKLVKLAVWGQERSERGSGALREDLGEVGGGSGALRTPNRGPERNLDLLGGMGVEGMRLKPRYTYFWRDFDRIWAVLG